MSARIPLRGRFDMKILVTAGNTQTMIDKVRCITNVFSGRTGAQIAVEAFERGHAVTLITSRPEILGTVPCVRARNALGWQVLSYRTFEELESLMAEGVTGGSYDAVIHGAAVSDYQLCGIYAPKDGIPFSKSDSDWTANADLTRVADVTSGKVKSHYPELWLRLRPAPKLVDKVRVSWGFNGVLVKFKLEVGVTDAELLAIAERSRVQSGADLMVANTLEGMHDWAFVGFNQASYRRVHRDELPGHLLEEICVVACST
jgi:phosphopantothenate-cysteine ligase/phosphopantothenoylcysteine decarboxylase/phosphopantothenate--cysteine ligase